MMRKDNDHKQSDKGCNNCQNHFVVAGAHIFFCKTRCQCAEEIAHHEERAALIRVNAGVRADTDIEKHKADGRCDTETDAKRNRFHDLFANIEDRKDKKYDTFDQNDAKTGLEGFDVRKTGDACDVGDHNGKERVKSHTGRHCERFVR